MDYDELSGLFAGLDRELWLVTAAAPTGRGGLISTSVSQASIVPELPRVHVGIARQHFTWQLIEQTGAFALHLLGDEHVDWVWRFGLRSGRQSDKLEGITTRTGTTGSPILPNALAWLEARVEARLDTGDRTIFLAEVLDGEWRRHVRPLTLKRLLQSASADKLREMNEQMAHDQTVDAAAIRAWRAGTPIS